MRESRLYAPVERFLGTDYLTRREVRVGSKIVDIFAVSKKADESLAIELKVSNWKRALKQAATYQTFAKYSYVALPRSHVHRALTHASMFRSLGVGLMSVKRDVEVHIEPAKSTCMSVELEGYTVRQIMT
jgi:hypothetical protein